MQQVAFHHLTRIELSPLSGPTAPSISAPSAPRASISAPSAPRAAARDPLPARVDQLIDAHFGAAVALDVSTPDSTAVGVWKYINQLSASFSGFPPYACAAPISARISLLGFAFVETTLGLLGHAITGQFVWRSTIPTCVCAESDVGTFGVFVIAHTIAFLVITGYLCHGLLSIPLNVMRRASATFGDRNDRPKLPLPAYSVSLRSVNDLRVFFLCRHYIVLSLKVCSHIVRSSR